MVMNKSFGQIKGELNTFRTNHQQKAAQAIEGKAPQIEETPVNKPYPQVGEQWKGPVYGAPYPNPQLDGSIIHKMPGMRKKWNYPINFIYKKFNLIYSNFFKMILCAIAGAFSFMFLPGTLMYLGFIFAAGAGHYWMYYQNHRVTLYKLEMNMACVAPMTWEGKYK